MCVEKIGRRCDAGVQKNRLRNDLRGPIYVGDHFPGDFPSAWAFSPAKPGHMAIVNPQLLADDFGVSPVCL